MLLLLFIVLYFLFFLSLLFLLSFQDILFFLSVYLEVLLIRNLLPSFRMFGDNSI